MIQDETINNVSQYFFSDDGRLDHRRHRQHRVRRGHWARTVVFQSRRHGVGDPRSRSLFVIRLIARSRSAAFVTVAICNRDRGVPFPLLLIVRACLRDLDVRRQAHDVRPPRLRRRRQRRGRPARRHQRRAHPHPRLHDLRASWRRWAASCWPRGSRASTSTPGGGTLLIDGDRGRRDRRHEPLRRPRRGAQRALRRRS